MRFRTLDEQLYGNDSDPNEAPDEEELQPTSDDQPASMPPEQEEPTPPPVSPSPAASAAPAKKSWSPNFLAAIAAFTQNPVLMQKIQAQQEEKRRKQIAAEQAPIKAAALKRQNMLDDIAIAKEGREQKKFDAVSPFLQQSEQSKIDSRQAGAQRMRGNAELQAARSDPKSEMSQGSVDVAKRAIAAYADALGLDTPAGKRLADAGAGLDGKSAAQVEQMLPTFEKLGASGIAQRHQKVMESQGWKSLNQGDERIGLARNADERAEEELGMVKAKPQEKLNETIGKLEASQLQMREALGLKSKVNTGPIIQGVRDLFSLDKFDALNSEERTNLKALGASIFNEKVHEISGAAVSESEWARIAPQIPEVSDDDETFVRKMNRALQITEEILAEKRKQYQLGANGRPSDRSTTAKEQVQKLRPTAASPQMPATTDPRVARAKEILADPTESPEKKAKAERWLKANQ